MKRLFLSLITLVAGLIGATQQSQAALTITPPTIPSILADSLKAGESYYLFNVGKGQYMNKNSYYCGWSDTPYAFRLDSSSDGYYAFWQGSYYIGSGSSISWEYNTTVTDQYVRYDIQGNAGIYKIRCVYNNSYIGYNSASSNVYNNANNGYDTWVLIPSTATDAQKTAATQYSELQKLYDAIANADAQGYSVKSYESIYKDSSKTYAQLLSAANELNAAVSFSSANSYIFPSWNDYKILLYSSNFSRYSSDNRLYTEWENNTQGTSRGLSAIVNITEPSTFVISTHYSNNAAFHQMQIYVDDSLAADYNKDMYFSYIYDYMYSGGRRTNDEDVMNSCSTKSSSGYRRYFVDLPNGEHKINIVFTKSETNYYHSTYINEIGIEKTPTLNVNLAAEGRLGDEVLMAMNNIDPDNVHIRNVRKLVVSGKMGTDDWN